MDTDHSGWWDTAQGERRWWWSLARLILSAGPIPRHVAFVMDGNRRYAKAHRLGTAVHGHLKGFQQLTKILDWCRDIGIVEVTVYAFSIENFKRSEEEVNGLMALAEEKFAALLAEREKLEEKQISFRFWGKIALLSPKLRQLLSELELLTKDYTKGVVNICMPYTSRDELARSFDHIRQGVAEGTLIVDDIDSNLISKCMDSHRSRDPDMLIRTSGEKRLSDFLLWQCSTSHIYYDAVLWPDFSFWNLCQAIISYQYYHSSIKNISSQSSDKNPSIEPFVDNLNSQKLAKLEEYATMATA